MTFNNIIDRSGTFCTQWDYIADRFGNADLLPFTISDTDFPVPKIVNHALQERLEHPIYGYTRWNHSEFKGAVQYWFKNRHQVEISQESIVYTPSVMYGVAKLIQLLSDRDDGVIVQTPAYDAFFKTVTHSGRKLIENQLVYDLELNTYTINFEELEELVTNPTNKILLLCSPHNPTGRVWTKEELDYLVNICQKNNVAIISDEIHMDIVHKDHEHISMANYQGEHIYIATSGTKTFNFPGLSFSYMLIPNTDIREKYLTILKSQDGLSSPSVLGMLATISAYNNCSDWVQQLNQYVKENIDFATQFIKKHLPDLKICQPESTYLLWIDISNTGYTQAEFQKKLIEIGKIAIMDGSIYGGNGENFIRLNLGCPRDKLVEGLDRMKKSFN